jgi:hypothetical protein
MNTAFPQRGANLLSKQACYSAGLEFGLTGVAQSVELAIGIGFDPDASNRIPSNAASLFNHLVGAGEQRRGKFEPLDKCVYI